MPSERRGKRKRSKPSAGAAYAQEVRPGADDPSCKICGAIMTPEVYKCRSCGATSTCTPADMGADSPRGTAKSGQDSRQSAGLDWADIAYRRIMDLEP